MPKPPAAEECVIFSNPCKTSSQSAKTTSPVKEIEASDMANVADVLTELKSLCSKFSSKLNNQLGELANSISVMENKVKLNEM